MKKKPIITVLFMVALTLFSKGLGLLRQMALASLFAASVEGVAFSAAQRIPMALFDMLFAGAIVSCFLPIYRAHLVRDPARAERFSSVFFTFTGLLTASVSLLGILFARPILMLAAPGLEGETLSLATRLLCILFPATFLAGLVYTLIGVMQSHERFFLPAAVSAVSNLLMLVYLLLFAKNMAPMAAVTGLAAVYLFSWLVQFLTLALPLMLQKHMPRPHFCFTDPDLILAGRRVLPVMLGAWLMPVITLTAGALSSYIVIEGLSEGAVMVAYENAFSVFTIAGGIVVYGLCNYLFPKLAEHYALDGQNAFSGEVTRGLSLVLTVTLPLAAFVAVSAKDIIRLLFLRGNFTEALAAVSGDILCILALALPAYGLMEFLTRTAHAAGNVRAPLAASLSGAGAGLLLAALLKALNHLSPAAIAACAVLSLWTATALLLVFLGNVILKSLSAKHLVFLLSLLAITAICAGVMALFRSFFKKILEKEGAFSNFLTIALVFILGFVVYLIWIIFLYRKSILKSSQSKEDTH